MKLLAIDPGPKQSAWIVLERSGGEIEPVPGQFGITDNPWLIAQLVGLNPAVTGYADRLAIEMVESFGMAVGREVFETVLWVGRIVQAWEPQPWQLVYRSQVKQHLCKSAKAKDSNIRQALIDRFGGSREAAIGRKTCPGPLHGIKRDCWSALAVGLTCLEAAK